MPLLLTLLLLAGCVAQEQPAPDAERLMQRIEAEIRMPEGSTPLESYERIYARAPSGEIVALYRRSGQPGRRWVDYREVPLVGGGGCGNIAVAADADGAILRARCNGPV